MKRPCSGCLTTKPRRGALVSAKAAATAGAEPDIGAEAM